MRLPPDLAGACGVPGCRDPECTIDYGYCHCGCGGETALAGSTWAATGTVRGEPNRYIRGHVGDHALRVGAVQMRSEHLMSLKAIAREVGKDPETVSRWLHAEGFDVSHAALRAARIGRKR